MSVATERNVISILQYHQIARVPAQHDPGGLVVSPEMFEKQMSYLHQTGHRCLSLGEAVTCLRKGLPQPRKSVVITFDDGFRDLHSTVWPILDRFGFGATVFFVSGRAGCESDWDGQSGKYAAPLLSWGEARELVRAGFTFGSHTVTHPRLTELVDKQAMDEIQLSKAMLEDRLGSEVNLFSYPYSDHNDQITRMVAECGYTAACGGERGDWGLFNLWRAQCYRSDNMLSFVLKASGWHHRFIWFREQSPVGPSLRRVVRWLRRLLRDMKVKSPVDTS